MHAAEQGITDEELVNQECRPTPRPCFPRQNKYVAKGAGALPSWNLIPE
jgi:hypothetical protein